MKDDEFREWSRRLAGWMADYRERVGERPVFPGVEPGAVLHRLPEAPPDEPEDMRRLLEDFESIILPAMTHWNHPRFFAFFPANTSAPSILAEMLTACLGAQCMSWETSPAATELEMRVMEWLRRMIGLPGTFEGVIQDTASSATLVAMLMARERATDGAFRRTGASAPGAARLRVYASTEAHSSVEKAVFLAGIGAENLRGIPTDEHYAMRADALEEAVGRDLRDGLLPAAVVATVGTTASTAIDPLPEIAAISRRHGVFLHVDAAFAGTAAILPEMRPILDGAEHADSLVFNPHKWMFTNFDCSAHFVRDGRLLRETCAIHPEYLRGEHDAEVVNYRDLGIPLGRRFRALKLWWVIRSFGVEGLRRRLREHLRLAAEFKDLVLAHPRFELMAPVPLSLVCFRHRPEGLDEEATDAWNRDLLRRINQSGRAYLSHARLKGRFVLRMAIGQERTTASDVRAAWDLILRLAEA